MKKFKKLLSLAFITATLAASIFGAVDAFASVKGKTYKIVSDTTYAPFEFQDANGKWVGIDMSLMKEIAKVEGFKVEIKNIGFNAAVQALESGQADGLMGGCSITPEREKKFDFSKPYYETSLQLAVRKEDKDKYKSYKDMKGKVFAGKVGSTNAEWLNDHAAEYGYTVKLFDTGEGSWAALEAGQVDGIMDDYPILAYAAAQGRNFALVCKKQPAGSFGFPVAKGQNAELLAAFNDGLAKLKKSGRYDEIINEYIADGNNKKNLASNEGTISAILAKNWKPLLKGLGITIALTLVSFFIATVVGTLIGLAGVSENKFTSFLASAYVDVFRGLPLMVLVFFIFFGLPQLIQHPLNDFVAGVIALALNASAYIAEIVRGGINAIDKGQIEASRSLGVTYGITMRKVVLPQAFKIMIPSLVNQFVITLKDTTIISAIGLIELLQAGKIIVARNLQSFKVYLIIGVIYLVIILALTKLAKALEKRTQY
ncbi:MAG: ABC transporter substrate-binding protein/permease [Lactobacillales bacterium]|jgi:polar amino acid transport system substrate-binding protein|nr:ABC transporter substrate-binding protein/permease [Lactobacillales bacterium]